jgi:hypothetical protein
MNIFTTNMDYLVLTIILKIIFKQFENKVYTLFYKFIK